MIESIIDIIIKVALFLCASYFIFYKAWLKALGKEVAKLSTVEKLTQLEESVKKDFNESIESYKAKLDEELALKIEPLKAELDKNNITHQIQFGFLHQERSKVITELYKKLIELHSAIAHRTAFLHPVIEDAEKEEQERITRVNQAIFEFNNFYISNKLFFQKDFCGDLDRLFNEYYDKWRDFSFNAQLMREGKVSHEFYKDLSAGMLKISRDIRDVLPAKITAIEEKFRELLHVEE